MRKYTYRNIYMHIDDCVHIYKHIWNLEGPHAARPLFSEGSGVCFHFTNKSRKLEITWPGMDQQSGRSMS